MRLYDNLIDFKNLYNAHKKARLGKRTKKEVIEFEMNLAENICILQEELRKLIWKPKGYYNFYISDPKLRLIYAPYYIDRVVQHCLCDNIISVQLEKRLIYDNAACRVGKGTHFSLKRLTGFLSDFHKQYGTNGYFLKMDIRKYFANIRHDVLKYKLAKIFEEQALLGVMYSIIDSYEISPGRGLPLGNQTRQWFALYYLDNIDHYIKEKLQIKYYVRYMDDFVLINESKDYLFQCLARLEYKIKNELGLEFNEKTQIFPITNGVNYLGFHFYLTGDGKIIRMVSNRAKKRYRKFLIKAKKDYALGIVDYNYIKPRLLSYLAHLKHGHTFRLRKRVFDVIVCGEN